MIARKHCRLYRVNTLAIVEQWQDLWKLNKEAVAGTG